MAKTTRRDSLRPAGSTKNHPGPIRPGVIVVPVGFRRRPTKSTCHENVRRRCVHLFRLAANGSGSTPCQHQSHVDDRCRSPRVSIDGKSGAERIGRSISRRSNEHVVCPGCRPIRSPCLVDRAGASLRVWSYHLPVSDAVYQGDGFENGGLRRCPESPNVPVFRGPDRVAVSGEPDEEVGRTKSRVELVRTIRRQSSGDVRLVEVPILVGDDERERTGLSTEATGSWRPGEGRGRGRRCRVWSRRRDGWRCSGSTACAITTCVCRRWGRGRCWRRRRRRRGARRLLESPALEDVGTNCHGRRCGRWRRGLCHWRRRRRRGRL